MQSTESWSKDAGDRSMRVLQLTTYPVKVPRHGGQARVANIERTYGAAGITTRVLAVYYPEYYAKDVADERDLPVREDAVQRRESPPLCTDIASGEFAAADAGAWSDVLAQITAFAPDVVQLEQPWLWPVVRRLRAGACEAPFRLVYSSQNVEAPLKARLLADHPVELVRSVVDRITGLEREVVAAADLTIAVTESDAETYREWGARQVLVAPNGIVERPVDPERVRAWDAHLGGNRFALFVGSTHPPNVSGFWEMFAPSLAFLAPDERILVVGGISDIIVDSPLYRRWAHINASRLERAGVQSEENLAALIALASCIVLPITIGGGSNIKTAEAIFSGRPVVGTSLSFRGFEAALSLPRVYRTDDPAEFRRLVKRAIEGSLPPGGADRPDIRRRVLWSETLKALPAEVRKLVQPAAAVGATPAEVR
jgi:glycosyltransferase involved in cell wall biosynthesis